MQVLGMCITGFDHGSHDGSAMGVGLCASKNTACARGTLCDVASVSPQCCRGLRRKVFHLQVTCT